MICGHCDKHLKFLPKDTNECSCEKPDRHVKSTTPLRGGKGGAYRYHMSCLKCQKRIKTVDDFEEDAANDCQLACACDKCNKKLSLLKFRFIVDQRTFIDDNIVQLKADYNLLCDQCINTIEYDIISRYLYCNVCHVAHEREFYSDTHGYGLCGYIVCHYSVHEPQTPKEYIINCGSGSRYDIYGWVSGIEVFFEKSALYRGIIIVMI